ncbi:hypothetical protein CFOL_v3_12523, partial [Cephalotus follicularis]
MENTKILTVSELIHRGRAHTGASYTGRPIHSPSSSKPNPRSQPPGPTKCKILGPLDHPAILIGTLTLPSQTLNCPNKNCFQFTDASATICCDILNFNLQLLGNKIHVTAWNFLPIKNGTGFLEIIKWNLPDISGSSLNSIPLISLTSATSSECNSKSDYRVHGALVSISPVNVVPCSTKSREENSGTDPKSLRGFLVQILACECTLCSSKKADLHSVILGQECHSFVEPVFVYFCGYSWCWHPVITKFLGNVVALSGLKKRLVYIEKEESRLMFVTTEYTVLHVPRLVKKWFPDSKTAVKGKGECGVYTGFVKGLYMQGMVVELEKDVWLLLTDQLLKPPHSLRVGAVHGVFTELCKHDSCGCLSETYCGDLKMVVPISSFLDHCKTRLIRMLLQVEADCNRLQDKSQLSFLSSEGGYSGCSMRRIFSSEDIGFILLGSLKISSSSGRLQVFDSTGSIDVIIPDLPSTWDAKSIYEIFDYSLIVEGPHDLVDHLGLFDKESLSCRSIFHSVPPARELNLALYIHFSLRSPAGKNICFYPCMNWKDDLKEVESGRFHLIQVAHKFPAVQKFKGDPLISNRSSKFVEAIVLPWDLILAGKDGISHLTEVSMDQLVYQVECHGGKSCQEHLSSKRRKIAHTSAKKLSSSNLNDISGAGSEQNACSGYYRETSEEQSHGSHEIQCMAAIRSVSNHSLISSGKLYCTNANVKTDAALTATAAKVLLEFNSSSSQYESLQIGGYYITKHHTEDTFCNIQDSDFVSGFKACINSTTSLWSLSFSTTEVPPTNDQLHHLASDIVSFSNDKFLSSKQIELLPRRSTSDSPGSCFDICLHVSADEKDLLSVISEGLEERRITPALPPEEVSNTSHCNWKEMPASMLSCRSNSKCLYQEGNLVSKSGYVVAIHGLDRSVGDVHPRCESFGDIQFRFFEEVNSTLCIHLLVDDQTVKIFSSLSKQTYPIGFGTGVNATFHRILDLGEPNGLILTPVSLIVINSIMVVDKPSSEKCSNLQSAALISNVASSDIVSSGLISDLNQCLDSKPMRFHCRVVAIHILVLEKSEKDNVLPKNHSQLHLVNIPLACFVLDDGSSSCFCWADAERAATLLRLHEELPQRAFDTTGWALKWVGRDNVAWNTTIYHVERILKKHDRITVKNYGSVVDSSCQDLVVYASSNNTLHSSDEKLLKFIILKACIGRFWTVVASAMDSNAVRQLEQHLTEKETRMQNIWAREVYYTNLLSEGRDVIQDIL